jgi:hypothetical protein
MKLPSGLEPGVGSCRRGPRAQLATRARARAVRSELWPFVGFRLEGRLPWFMSHFVQGTCHRDAALRRARTASNALCYTKFHAKTGRTAVLKLNRTPAIYKRFC